jgi:hypothetical protein
VHEVGRVRAGAEPGQTPRERGIAVRELAEGLRVHRARGERDELVQRRFLRPQLEVLELFAELPELDAAALEGLAVRQLVRVVEREQMHVVLAAELAQQVEPALQDAAMRRVGHDLRDEEDAHQ